MADTPAECVRVARQRRMPGGMALVPPAALVAVKPAEPGASKRSPAASASLAETEVGVAASAARSHHARPAPRRAAKPSTKLPETARTLADLVATETEAAVRGQSLALVTAPWEDALSATRNATSSSSSGTYAGAAVAARAPPAVVATGPTAFVAAGEDVLCTESGAVIPLDPLAVGAGAAIRGLLRKKRPK